MKYHCVFGALSSSAGNLISAHSTMGILNEVQSRLNRAAFHLTAPTPKPFIPSFVFAGQDICSMEGFWS